MYKIIGGDNREYGPVSIEQLREWLRQGRINENTMVQAVGSTGWMRLSSIPEFGQAGHLPPLLAHAPDPEIREHASKKLAAGICAVLIGSLGIHKYILGYNTAGTIMLLVSILTCGVGAIAMWIIGLIEGIIYLCKSDRDFVDTYIRNRREWF